MMLVTPQQASDHIRRDTDADEDTLTLMIEAASDAVMSYLGAGSAEFTDSAGDVFLDSNGIAVGVPARVKQATLITVAALYRERDGSQQYAVDKAFGYGYPLPQGATALLYTMRKPTVL
jgi:hypothetical protein